MLTTQDSKPMFLFSTPVILHDLENSAVINAELLKRIHAHKDVTPSIRRSNYGGWHSAADMTVWCEDIARVILNAAMSQATQYTADIRADGKRDFVFDAQMWANINGPGDSNQSHCHTGSLWSGVYYVDNGEGDPNVDVEGELILTDPRFPMNTMYMPDLVTRDMNSAPQYSQYPIRPINGRLVLFPSWLNHSVRPYLGKRLRVSVAFNLTVHVVSSDKA